LGEENFDAIVEFYEDCNVLDDDMGDAVAAVYLQIYGLHVKQVILQYANNTHVLILQHSGSKLV
jgi:uridine phosphorylase